MNILQIFIIFLFLSDQAIGEHPFADPEAQILANTVSNLYVELGLKREDIILSSIHCLERTAYTVGQAAKVPLSIRKGRSDIIYIEDRIFPDRPKVSLDILPRILTDFLTRCKLGQATQVVLSEVTSAPFNIPAVGWDKASAEIRAEFDAYYQYEADCIAVGIDIMRQILDKNGEMVEDITGILEARITDDNLVVSEARMNEQIERLLTAVNTFLADWELPQRVELAPLPVLS
jgi:hypothetical protein